MNTPRTCRSCGCTEADCRGCVERTGYACYWVDYDLCSACFGSPPPLTKEPKRLFFVSSTASLTREAFIILNQIRREVYQEERRFWDAQMKSHDVKAPA